MKTRVERERGHQVEVFDFTTNVQLESRGGIIIELSQYQTLNLHRDKITSYWTKEPMMMGDVLRVQRPEIPKDVAEEAMGDVLDRVTAHGNDRAVRRGAQLFTTPI